nr:prepilin-type N-terminal cleavage/methylation domain-containing protein [Listeria monocytogenes]
MKINGFTLLEMLLV